jgi:hypothetical protein
MNISPGKPYPSGATYDGIIGQTNINYGFPFSVS